MYIVIYYYRRIEYIMLLKCIYLFIYLCREDTIQVAISTGNYARFDSITPKLNLACLSELQREGHYEAGFIMDLFSWFILHQGTSLIISYNLIVLEILTKIVIRVYGDNLGVSHIL